MDSIPASSTTSVAPGRQPELGQRWPVGALPFVEQLGDGVGADAGVALEGAGRLRRRRHREHDPTVRVQVVGGGGEHAGLAGTGRADDQHEPVVAGDRRRGVGLQRIETVAGRRWSTGRAGRLGRPSPT